ncbi:unnamed protein product [Peniophora sp. CBMAI 1063]|nr:unnamed protein product [Peniophora sp. CBMAI 1063]
MVGTVDPTFPLYPIISILSATTLFLVLLTSFVRQSWNLGVAFLCFWLFWENLTNGIDAVIWSDNADLRLYVYCDLVSHIQVITSVVRPMATLIIIRRLYSIVNLRIGEGPRQATRRKDLVIEWTLGLAIPAVVAGPLYYIVQPIRFAVHEGFGCADITDISILSLLLVNTWNVIPPLVSLGFYYPAVFRAFYLQNRDVNHHLQTNGSVSRVNYFRVLALASIDLLLTLPIGIINVVFIISGPLTELHFPFYSGWTQDHVNWGPQSASYAELAGGATSHRAQLYFDHWTSPILALAIFGLFGVTSEARASYWRIVYTIGGWVGWKLKPRTHDARASLGDIEFGARSPQSVSINFDVETQPTFIDGDDHIQQRVEATRRTSFSEKAGAKQDERL